MLTFIANDQLSIKLKLISSNLQGIVPTLGRRGVNTY